MASWSARDTFAFIFIFRTSTPTEVCSIIPAKGNVLPAQSSQVSVMHSQHFVFTRKVSFMCSGDGWLQQSRRPPKARPTRGKSRASLLGKRPSKRLELSSRRESFGCVCRRTCAEGLSPTDCWGRALPVPYFIAWIRPKNKQQQLFREAGKTPKSCPGCCRLSLTHSPDTPRLLAICVLCAVS